jgi:uncharacterized membrane protein/thiol-disulfide isomerase/thioredoxin
MDKWLKQANYAVDFHKFEISLLSHPDYGGLTSITDTLTEFGIENTAAQLPFNAIHNLSEPFLTLIKQDHQELFVLLYPTFNGDLKLYLGSNNSEKITLETLKTLWTGNIVVIDKKLRTKKIWVTPNLSVLGLSILPILLTLLYIFSNPTLLLILFFILSILGILLSIQIVNHQLGLENSFTSKFCTLGLNTSCDSVLNDKSSKLTKSIRLSDIGIIYFASQILISLFSGNLHHSAISIQYLLSISAVPFILYSLYLQKYIIKKWCPLCLGVLGILFVQGIIAGLAINRVSIADTEMYSLLVIPVITLIVITAWKLLIHTIKGSISAKELTIESLSFRKNYYLLLPYLKEQISIQTDFNFETLEIGNSHAKNRLVLITNPLCESCIKLHHVIEKLITSYNDLSVKQIYYVPLNNTDPRTIIAGHLLAQNKTKKFLLIKEWYSNPNPEFFTNKYGKVLLHESAITLQKHKDWCHSNRIYKTPTLLLNGKRFPNIYRPEDMEFLIEEILYAAENKKNEVASNCMFVD